MELARDWDAGPYRPVNKDSRDVKPEIIPISRRASVPRAAPTALAMRLHTPIATRHSSTWGPKSTPTTEAMKAKATSRQTNTHTQEAASVAERILAEDAGARIVVLTTFSDDEYIVRALKMGARGYLIKQDVAQVAPALRSVMAGVCVLEGEVLERSTTMGLGGPAGGREQAEECPGPTAKDLRSTAFAALTDREYEVVEAVAEGLDNAEAAARLFMSEGTVRNHISAILAKLGLRNRTQVAVMYYRCAQAG